VIVDERQVELAGLEPRDQTLEVIVDDRQCHRSVAAPESSECRWRERAQSGREAAEAQPAVATTGELSELLLGAVEPSEDAGGVPREHVAGLGQLDRPRAALDQRQADLSLECCHVLAHGRLRDSQRVRRGREGTAAGDFGQHAQPTNVEH
jgi:hypothetical protein